MSRPVSDFATVAAMKDIDKIKDEERKIKCIRAMTIITEGTVLFSSSPIDSARRLSQALDSVLDIPEAKSIHAFCYVHLSAAYGRCGELSRSIALGQKALDILNNSGEIPDQEGLCLYNMGTMYCKMENFEAAIPYLKKAVALLSRIPGQEKRTADSKNNLLYAKRMLKKKKGFFGWLFGG